MPKTDPFERYVEEYEAWFDRHDDLYRAELRALRELLPPRWSEGAEVGVGTGRFAGPLGIRTGVEPSPRMAEKATALGIDVHPGTAEHLPFSDGVLDLVLMVTTICFVDDVPRAFAEARRVLRPGGSIVVGFIDGESGPGRRYDESRSASRFYRDAVFLSAAEVTRLLEQAGFVIGGARQTLVEGEPPGTVLDGAGRGAFAVIRGDKRGDG